MKVLLVTGMNSIKFGSLEKWILLFGKELKEKGIKLIVHYNNPPESAFYINSLEEFKIDLISSNIPTKSVSQIFFFKKIIDQIKPTFVHAFFNSKVLYAGFLCGFKKNELFWTNPLEMPKFKMSHLITSSILNRIVTIFPASEAIRLQMNRSGYTIPSRNTWYFGLPVEFLNNHNENLEENDAICSIGHFRSIKGMDLLLRAFSLVKNKIESARLIQVGIDIENHPEFNLLAEELSIQNDIEWMGIIDDAQDVIPRCSVYVQPSRKEAMSFTVMEASYYKKPVVAFKVGGIPEAIYDNESGYLVEPENYTRLAEKIILLLEDKKLREKLGQRGRTIVADKLLSTVHIKEQISQFFLF